MRTGRTVTKQLKIETRQHELIGLDLGEGPRRKELVLGLIIVPAWIAFLFLLIGAPTKGNSLLYMVPPVLFLRYGVSENEKNSRRMNFTQWILAIRYALLGHRPIIRSGARNASAAEQIPWFQRANRIFVAVAKALLLGHLVKRNGQMDWEQVSQIPGFGFTSRYVQEAGNTAYKQASGKPVEVSPTAYLVGTDYLVGVGKRARQKKSRKKK